MGERTDGSNVGVRWFSNAMASAEQSWAAYDPNRNAKTVMPRAQSARCQYLLDANVKVAPLAQHATNKDVKDGHPRWACVVRQHISTKQTSRARETGRSLRPGA